MIARRWNPERSVVEFGIGVGEYDGTVSKSRRVFQSLLGEGPTPERCIEAYYLHRTRLELIAERKVRRRQLSDDGMSKSPGAIFGNGSRVFRRAQSRIGRVRDAGGSSRRSRQQVPHGGCIPLPAPRRKDAPPVQLASDPQQRRYAFGTDCRHHGQHLRHVPIGKRPSQRLRPMPTTAGR